MTRAQIVTEVQNAGFPNDAPTTLSIQRWIAAREGEVWQYADWPIKDTAVLNVAVTNGVATIPLPTGITIAPQVFQLFDENGSELDFLDPMRFYSRYQPYVVPSVSAGAGESWTITTDVSSGGTVTLQLRVGPTPNATRTYTVRGWSLPICRSAAATWKLGTMSADTDLPWWPDDFHFFLVSGVVALGGEMNNMLDSQVHEQRFQQGLDHLADELLPIGRLATGQWGSWVDGAYGNWGLH